MRDSNEYKSPSCVKTSKFSLSANETIESLTQPELSTSTKRIECQVNESQPPIDYHQHQDNQTLVKRIPGPQFREGKLCFINQVKPTFCAITSRMQPSKSQLSHKQHKDSLFRHNEMLRPRHGTNVSGGLGQMLADSRRKHPNEATMRTQPRCYLPSASVNSSNRMLTLPIFTGLKLGIVLALTMSCLLQVPLTLADSGEQPGPVEHSDTSMASSQPLNRVDLASASSQVIRSSTSDEPQKSIVASLSSALATAAAASAVAAAQNSLSNNDARSVHSHGPSPSTGSRHNPRSSSLNLAIKFADAIPEVPYSILHNMKKLDHAAPFYNVANKMNGASKESTSGSSLLASALSGSGGPGYSASFAAEQLANMLRSPLWKRIADGAGDFASEFRSLFRAQQPSPMKGTSSPASASKLLRDISVPALLVLLASAIPSEWRPGMRSRRKSSPSAIAELGGSLDPLAAAFSNSASPSFALPVPRQMSQGNQLTSDAFQFNGFEAPQAQARVAAGTDFHAQPSQVSSSWMSQGPVGHQQATNIELNDYQSSHQSVSSPMTSNQQVNGATQNIRRSGESAVTGELTVNKSLAAGRETIKAVTTPAPVPAKPSSLFSSLTSSLANKSSKLMNKLISVNGNDLSGSLTRFASDFALASAEPKFVPLTKRDQLSDKHKYSLISSADENSVARSPILTVNSDVSNIDTDKVQQVAKSSSPAQMVTANDSQIGEANQRHATRQPFLLSAMTQALDSLLLKTYTKQAHTQLA